LEPKKEATIILPFSVIRTSQQSPGLTAPNATYSLTIAKIVTPLDCFLPQLTAKLCLKSSEKSSTLFANSKSSAPKLTSIMLFLTTLGKATLELDLKTAATTLFLDLTVEHLIKLVVTISTTAHALIVIRTAMSSLTPLHRKTSDGSEDVETFTALANLTI